MAAINKNYICAIALASQASWYSVYDNLSCEGNGNFEQIALANK